MLKRTCLTTLLAAGLMLTACSNGSRSMVDGGTKRNNDTGRVDASGNRVYDLGSSDPARVGDSNGLGGEEPGSRAATDQASATSKRSKDGTWRGDMASSNRDSESWARDGMRECDCCREYMMRRDSRSDQSARDNKSARDMQDGRTSGTGQAGQYGQNDQYGQTTASGQYGQDSSAKQNRMADGSSQTRQSVSITPGGKTSQTLSTDTSRTTGQYGQSGSSDQSNVYSSREKNTTADQNSSNLTSWNSRSWDNQSVRATAETDLPAAARTGLTREAGGSALAETSRGMWNGKPAYCAKVTRGSYSYKVITDEQGDLIAMHRID